MDEVWSIDVKYGAMQAVQEQFCFVQLSVSPFCSFVKALFAQATKFLILVSVWGTTHFKSEVVSTCNL